jgi:hypothetical protein
MQHEIKGAAFVTLRRQIASTRGEPAWSEVVARVPELHRSAVRDATASAWYPEEAHAAVLTSVFETIAQRDLDELETIVDASTTLGLQTFARAILALSSPAFVVRRCPTLWSVIRRGPATLRVEQPEPGLSRLHYESFPYFDDRLYRHYFRALLGAVVRPALGTTPVVRLVSHTTTTLDVEIVHR